MNQKHTSIVSFFCLNKLGTRQVAKFSGTILLTFDRCTILSKKDNNLFNTTRFPIGNNANAIVLNKNKKNLNFKNKKLNKKIKLLE